LPIILGVIHGYHTAFAKGGHQPKSLDPVLHPRRRRSTSSARDRLIHWLLYRPVGTV